MARRWFVRLGVMILGAAASLAFPEPAWWWLGWVGLVPILVLIGGQAGSSHPQGHPIEEQHPSLHDGFLSRWGNSKPVGRTIPN